MLAFGLVAAGLLGAPARPASAQVFSAGVRISQIYTRGGEPGAAFRDDFIELFNAGPSPVELNGWELHIATLEGNVTRVVSASIFPAAGAAASSSTTRARSAAASWSAPKAGGSS